MKLRKDITLLEMGKIADVLEETQFIVEEMPEEDQSNLGLALLYLIKYTSGVDGTGQIVERYGTKR